MNENVKAYKVVFGNDKTMIVTEEDLSVAAAANNGIKELSQFEFEVFRPLGIQSVPSTPITIPNQPYYPSPYPQPYYPSQPWITWYSTGTPYPQIGGSVASDPNILKTATTASPGGQATIPSVGGPVTPNQIGATTGVASIHSLIRN